MNGESYSRPGASKPQNGPDSERKSMLLASESHGTVWPPSDKYCWGLIFQAEVAIRPENH